MALMPRRASSLSIQIPDMDRRIHAMRVLMPKAFERGLEAGVRAGAITVQEAAKDNVDGEVLNRRSGDLWRSIQEHVFKKAGTVVGIVGTHMKYAAIHEFGGTIRPRKDGGVLVFEVPGEEGPIFAREVTIPARPYMSKAFDEKKDRVVDLMEKHIMKEVKKAMSIGFGTGHSTGGA